MGDVVLVAPVIQSVLKSRNDIKIVFVTQKLFLPFFENHERLIVEIFDKTKNKGVIGLYKFYNQLNKKYNIDIVCDLHDVLRTNVLNTFFKLSGKKTFKIEKGRKEKKQLIKSKSVDQPLKHTTQRYLDVFTKVLEDKIGLLSYNLNPKGEINDFLLVHNLLPKNNKWVGIAPFAQHQNKILPQKKMEQLINQLLKYDVQIFLFGGGSIEMEKLDSIKDKYPSVIIASKSLKLNQELVLINMLDKMVTMDSSNMHMAALVGTKTVSFWGCTHPSMGFSPWGEGHVQIISNSKSTPCSVYGNKPCELKEVNCIDLINIDKDIIDHI